MKSLRIDQVNKELEIYEIDKNNLIDINLSSYYKDEVDYVSIGLTIDEVKKVIEFLQRQIGEKNEI